MGNTRGLDPKDWDDFRTKAHRMLDACIDQLSNASDYPWKPVPAKLKKTLAIDGMPKGDAAMIDKLTEIMPNHSGNTHPRFWGWVQGTGLASSLISEMASVTMNANCGGRDHASVYIERAVIEWSRTVMGMPNTASGILVAGTSQATLNALHIARVRALPDLRKTGNVGAQLVAYAGADVHNATKRAMEVLGLGSENLRLIPKLDGALDLATLGKMIIADRAEGMLPFAMIATAGSVDAGEFDDLNACADLAAAHDIWLHIDGAFGAWTRLADEPYRALTNGIGRAHSIAMDFHKWMYVPYDCGMLLVHDEAAHRAGFAARPAYLAAQSVGVGGGDPWYCDYGVDLSRGNRALKVWAALETHGVDAFGAAITSNCEMAAKMGSILLEPMRLARPVVSNLCVFTANAGLPDAEQSTLNTRIAQELQLSGDAVFSTTLIDGVTVLRAAIANHRTRPEDIETAIKAVQALT